MSGLLRRGVSSTVYGCRLTQYATYFGVGQYCRWCVTTSLVRHVLLSLVVTPSIVVVQAEEELPERLLGTCRFSHLDMDSGMFLDHDGKLHPRNPEASQSMRPLPKHVSKVKDN